MQSLVKLFGALLLPLVVVAILSALLPHPADATPSVPAAMTQASTPGSIGQTFVARHAGLQALDLYLGVDGGNGPAELVLHLRTSALADQADLRVARLIAQTPITPGWYRFEFPTILQSRNEMFYFFLEGVLPSGATLVTGTAPGSTYSDGALYIDHQPREAQLVFRPQFGSGRLWYDALSNVGQWLVLLLIMLVLFVVPGLALQWYLLGLPVDRWKEQLGLAAGISFSIYPLFLLWGKTLSVRLGAATVWTPILAGIAAIGWSWWRGHRAAARQAWAVPTLELADLVWISAVTLVVCVRLSLLNHLDTPMWGDSVQHAVIAQLLVEQGGLFDSWLPYTPYETLTVHFGFHAAIAAVMWLSGIDVLDATLQAGQMVNTLAIVALVPLATRLVGNRWAGLGVVIGAGLCSPLPHYYVNWGRYSQLLGQTIMPITVWLIWRMFDEPATRRWQTSVLAAVACAGTFLAYYRMPHYVAVAVIMIAVFHVGQRRSWRALTRPVVTLAVTGLLTGLLVLPWLLQLRGGALADAVEAGVAGSTPLATVLREYEIFRQPNPLLPTTLVVMACVACGWALLRRRVPVIVVGLWTIAILLLPASQLIRVPGANKQQGFAILISLYMLIGLLVGAGIDAWLGWLRARGQRLAVLGCALLLVLTAAPTYQRLRVVDPIHRMLAPADLRAMAWIREHTAPDARFLVDGFLIYNGTSAVGSDGGWWLSLLTRRQSTMPPQYALLNERPTEQQYNQRVVDWIKQTREVGVTSSEGIDLLCRTNITHLYVGQGQGMVATPPPQPMLLLVALEASPAFTLLYRHDKVGIFALNQNVCR